jgi:hypothetical protein
VATDSWVQRTKFVWFNAAMVLGVLIGFRLSPPMSVEFSVRVAVFCIAFFNLLFFGIVHRIAAATAQGGIRRNPYSELFLTVSERPAATVLAFIQLWGGARGLATAVTMSHTASSDYVKSLPNAGSIHTRLIVVSIVMVLMGGAWLLGAVGVWRTRKWAWWLTLCLNGLASATTIAIQVFRPHELLVDLGSTVAVIVLLLPSTRRAFHISAGTNLTSEVLPAS